MTRRCRSAPVAVPLPVADPEAREAGGPSRGRQAARVRRVLQTCPLGMVFQPIFELRTMAVAAFEALARFRTEPRQRPDRWFREAAEVGLGTRLELTAVRATLDHLPDLPGTARLSINVSPATATGAGIRAALASARAHRVILELTEHVRVTRYRALERSLRELRSGGVRLAIDDVGAGSANLRHVVRLRPDIIKLDVGLVQGVDTDRMRSANRSLSFRGIDEEGT